MGAQWERFEPNNWAQQRAFETTMPEVLYSGRLGSSKSRTACEKADLRCRLYPGARVAITRRYQTDLFNSTFGSSFARDVVSPRELQAGWRPSNPGGATFFYPTVNGKQSTILFAGLDRPGSLNSAEFDLIIVDQAEEVEEHQWDTVGGRLRHRHGPYRQLAGFCNPDGPAHFLFQRFRPDKGSHVQRLQKPTTLLDGSVAPAGTPIRETILAGPRDNLENLTADYQLRIMSYRGTLRDRMVLGKWVMPIGLVYSGFNPDIHILGKPPESWRKWGNLPPPDWQRFCGIDLGFDNPFVCLWFAESPDGHLYVYREIYFSHRHIVAHAKQVLRQEEIELETLREAAKRQGQKTVEAFAPYLQHLNLVARITDHDKGERALLDEAFGEAGTQQTMPAIKGITAMNQSVMTRLQAWTYDPEHPNDLERASWHPRIFFMRDMLVEADWWLEENKHPQSTLEEFGRYRYHKRKAGDAAEGRYDIPVDRDNHGMDALGYGVGTWDRSFAPSIISLGGPVAQEVDPDRD